MKELSLYYAAENVTFSLSAIFLGVYGIILIKAVVLF